MHETQFLNIGTLIKFRLLVDMIKGDIYSFCLSFKHFDNIKKLFLNIVKMDEKDEIAVY